MRELVVVLCIGLILVTFLLVFIGQLRERAHRLHCENNLMQMGKAVTLFNKEYLPPSRIADGYATWAVLLAPYLARDSALKNWDLERRYFEQPEAARQAFLRVYYCPARRSGPEHSVSGDVPGPGKPNVPGGLSDYACAAGDGDPRYPWTTARANGPFVIGKVTRRDGDAILEWQPCIQWSDLKRGKSHTILLGEKYVPLDHFGAPEFGDGSVYNGANPASFSRVAGRGFGLAQSATDPFNRNFGSGHPGICQFLMADGSVRPIKTTISETVLGELVVRE
jgi:hypothetical protein